MIPAASAGDETAIAAALRALDEAYRAHRQAIEVVVRTAQQANVRAEAMLLGVPFVPVTDEDRATQTKGGWQLPDTVNFLLTNDK